MPLVAELVRASIPRIARPIKIQTLRRFEPSHAIARGHVFLIEGKEI